MDKKDRKQITFDVSNEMHQQIKILATLRNVSMTLWMARAINDRIAKEHQYNEKLKEENGKNDIQ